MAEERRQKTDQLLITSPVSLTGIVAGKFLAALTVMTATLLCTLVYVGIIAHYGQVFAGEVFVGVLGLFLQGASFIAMGLFISTVTKNQVSAAVGSFGMNLVLWLLDILAHAINVPFLRTALIWLSLYHRYESFLLGQFSYANTLFYLSFCAVLLLSAIRALDARRWRED